VVALKNIQHAAGFAEIEAIWVMSELRKKRLRLPAIIARWPPIGR